jgi:Tfp pilus assembly major pilin PilA
MKTMTVSHLTMLTTVLCCTSFFVFPSQETNDKKEEKEIITSIKQQSDVLQDNINTMMQDSASWLDSLANNNSQTSEGAAATGYLQLGWLPRSADWSELDPKFKVRLSLPRWNERIALVLDNDDEDELLLDYEASSLNSDDDPEKLNIALQYIKTFDSLTKVKFRAGISRNQLYARSEVKYQWLTENYTVTVVPRLDYFKRDGWAPSVKSSVVYPLTDSVLSFSASWQEIEKEESSRQKIGLYHIGKIGDAGELVSGIQYSNNENSEESLLLSIRHRTLLYKDWMFFELEPFVEFRQENDYRREFGLAIRLISYYGKV